MNFIFELIAVPLGLLLKLIYGLIPNYFIAIFLFVLVTRILLFPLSLKTQKGQADRMRLAPRLDRLKEKYSDDPKKLQEKQMKLYEKHGVSPTGGCMPMLVQMLVLFGIISVVYSPIKHLSSIPTPVVDASITAMTGEGEMDAAMFKGYYRELRMMQNITKYEKDVKAEIAKLDGYDEAKATEYYNEIVEFEDQFSFFGQNMLEQPWSEKGFLGINVLWLIPLLSGITAFLSSLLTMHYNKITNGEQVQGQGCSNAMLYVMTPAMSLFIAFSVPGAVGIYWICSNLIALLQTYILNKIYNPAKIRAEAEKEYAERRKKKQEDKKRLAESRAREQRELALEQNKEKEQKSQKKQKPAKQEDAPTEETKQENEKAE